MEFKTRKNVAADLWDYVSGGVKKELEKQKQRRIDFKNRPDNSNYYNF